MALSNNAVVFGAQPPGARVFKKLNPAIIAAGSAAVKEPARPGFTAGMSALGRLTAARGNLHAHPEIVRARAQLPPQHRPGFDAAVSLAYGSLRRPPHSDRSWGPLGHAAYWMTHGARDAPTAGDVVSGISDAGPEATDATSTAMVEISHEEKMGLRVAEVTLGGAAGGGGTYYLLGLKTALALAPKLAISGGVGIAIGGLIWVLRHKRWHGQ